MESTQIAKSLRSTHEMENRGRVAARYREIREFTERLCQPLAIEDYVVQSMPDASPAKWHLAHVSWFFHTFVLEPARSGIRAGRPEYRYLFNSYYNAVGPMHSRPERGMLSRPTVSEIYRYRREIDDAMLEFIETADEERWRDAGPIVTLGLNHEQQHQELILTDIKHMLGRNPLYPVYSGNGSIERAATPEPEWLWFGENVYWIGAAGEDFFFDNEAPRHRTFAHAFEIASRPVTVGEYIEFIEDGGYARPELWLSAGWAAVQERGWTAPLYWERREGEWRCFTLAGIRPVRSAEPVCHLSYFEADAFARWAGARLPSEAEWEIASAQEDIGGNFAESGHYHPRPIGSSGSSNAISSSAALLAMFGDVWEWTRSSYEPYPGYRPVDGALGEYNGKFMSGQYVLRGGSCATPRSHIRRTYRNFFGPDKRWQFSGVRLARDA